MSNLLAVDFDMFFPNPWGDTSYTGLDICMYDWGHKEAPFFIESIWPSRASGFLANELPLPDLDGRQNGFWDRFKISKGAILYYADSNACAVNPMITGRRKQWDSVWLYDAHHDAGYHGGSPLALIRRGMFSCEDWMVLYAARSAGLHVRYPQWRAWAMHGEPTPMVSVDRQVDDGSTPDVVFDRVFVCRSGAWVPSWNNIDAKFEDFVQAAPVKHKIDVQPGGLSRRHYDQSYVDWLVTAHRSSLDQFVTEHPQV